MFIDFVATVPLDEVCAHIFARARGNEAEAFPPLPAQKRCSSSSCRACEGRRRAARRRARPSSCASCASSRSRACYGCCARPRSGGCSESMRCARAAATESGRHPWFASRPPPSRASFPTHGLPGPTAHAPVATTGHLPVQKPIPFAVAHLFIRPRASASDGAAKRPGARAARRPSRDVDTQRLRARVWTRPSPPLRC